MKKPRVSPPASAATGFSSGDVPPPDLQARLRAKAAGARPPPPRRAAPPVASAAPASAAAATPPEPAAATPSGFAPIAFVPFPGNPNDNNHTPGELPLSWVNMCEFMCNRLSQCLGDEYTRFDVSTSSRSPAFDRPWSSPTNRGESCSG